MFDVYALVYTRRRKLNSLSTRYISMQAIMKDYMKPTPSTPDTLTYGTEGLGEIFEAITAGISHPFKKSSITSFITNIFTTMPVTRVNTSLIKKMEKTDLTHLLERKIERPPYLAVQFNTYIETLIELFEEYGVHTEEVILPAVEWLEAVISKPNSDSKLFNAARMQKASGSTDVNEHIEMMSSMFKKDNTVSVNQSIVAPFIDMFHSVPAFVKSGESLAKAENMVKDFDAARISALEERLLNAVKYYGENSNDFDVPKESLRQFSVAMRTISTELEFLAAIMMQIKTAAGIYDRIQSQLKADI